MQDISVEFCDTNAGCIAALRGAFAGVAEISFVNASMCSRVADCVVTPGNSFGYMDGSLDGSINTWLSGYDASERIGDRTRREIRQRFYGEQPVGTCMLVPTRNHPVRWLAHCPTMRIPENVADTLNAYNAFRGMLLEVLLHNRTASGSRIRTILCSSLCTGAGEMSPEASAKQMRGAWDSLVNPSYTYDWKATREHHRLLQS